MSAETQRIYVYGIIRFEADRELAAVLPAEGLAGNPVRTVAGDGLAAIASGLAMPAENRPFEEELEEPERARSLILDHYRVLRQTVDDRTVLPVRFGALFSDDASVLAALEENRRTLLDALDRVEGAREWGVKIFCDRQALCRHVEATSSAVRAAQGKLSEATEGRAFFMRRQIARLGEEEVQRAIAQKIDASRQSLGNAARADRALKLQPASVHGCADEMVWNGALLVARSAEQRLLSMVDGLEQADAQQGFHYEVTGPWPPFSFVDCQLGGGKSDCPNGA
jgi:hypothetical protein